MQLTGTQRPTGTTTCTHKGCRRLAGERGFTLIEVLVAASVLLMGIMSTMGVFTSSKRATASAHRHEVALNVAERELDEMRRLDYEELSLTALSTSLQDPPVEDSRHPLTNNQWILRIRSGPPSYYEVGVAPNTEAEFGPTEPFEVGGDGIPSTPNSGAVTGNIYRYVTWREDGCTAALCVGQDTKRISIAVTIDSTAGGAAPRPVWVSSIVNDPDAGVTQELLGPPGGNASLTADRFYLQDQSCVNVIPGDGLTSHPTRNTAAKDDTEPLTYSPLKNSRCSYNQPRDDPPADTELDLMTTDRPLMGPSDPSFDPMAKYSADTGDTESYKGLRLRRQGAYAGTCDTASTSIDDTRYAWLEGDAGGLNKWNVHRWSTNRFVGAPYVLSRKVGLTLHTRTLSGAALRGAICVTLIDRDEGAPWGCWDNDGNGVSEDPDCDVPTENVLASFPVDRPDWNPPDFHPDRYSTFSRRWDLPDTDGDGDPDPITIPADHRLVLAISIHASSADDLVLAYGHPAFPSNVAIETTTPVSPESGPS